MMSPSYCRCATVDTSAVSDRVVLLERQSRRTLVLNPTGSALWNLLATPRTPEELVRHIRTQFPTLSAPQAQQDVEAYLRELLEQHLIEPAS